MNQVANKVPYGLLTKDEQEAFNTKGFAYQSWVPDMWVTCVFEDSYTPRNETVYRLVIEPEKYYFCKWDYGKHESIEKGSVLKLHHITSCDHLRPAKQSEKPQPVTLEDKIKAKYSGFEVVMLEWVILGSNEENSPYLCYTARGRHNLHHTAAQSMKGFFKYVYNEEGDLIHEYDYPTKPWKGKTLQPVAVLFEKGE